MDLSSVFRISPVSGYTLNVEESSGLEVAMLQRKLQENLVGKLFFWGKIFGSTQDYLIVHNINPYDEFPDKKFYFCTTSDYTLRALPYINEDYKQQAEKITSAFLGDPSFFSYNGEEAEPEDPEAPPVERFREVHRLTHTVKKIDHDVAIVPRGALSVDTGKRIILNSNYSGLSYQTSQELRAYLHFRPPESLQGIALLKRPGIVKTDDFLDCIDKDAPKEIWSITHDSAGLTAYVRNLYWEGYSFYTILKTNEHGGVYFGTGVPNYDIAFML